MNYISFRHHLLKIANFLQSENTRIFTEKFSNKDTFEIKALADRAYSLFGTWKDYDGYRSLLSSISSWEEMESFVSKAERSINQISAKISELGVPANVAEDMGRQYLHKYISDLNSDIFISRINDLKLKNEFFSLLRGEKKKTDLPPELEGKDLSGLGKDYIEWIKGVLDISRAGIEVHSVEDIISIAKIFRSSEMKLNKKISEFKKYSEVSNYLDQNSGASKPLYIESIKDLAQSGDMSKIIYDDERWTVVLIGSTVAGQWWGSDTDFCISSISNNLFSGYAVKKNKDPYFIIDKFAKSSNNMRKFTIAIEYADDGSSSISKDRSTITDAANQSIDLEKIYSYLENYKDKIFNSIMSDARKRNKSLGRENNNIIEQKIKDWDLDFITKYKKEINCSPNLRNMLLERLDSEKYLFLIKDSFDIIVQDEEPADFIDQYSKYPILDKYLKIAAKRLFDRNSMQVLDKFLNYYRRWDKEELETRELRKKYYLPYLDECINIFLTVTPRSKSTKEDLEKQENFNNLNVFEKASVATGDRESYYKVVREIIIDPDKIFEKYKDKVIKTAIDKNPIGFIKQFNSFPLIIPYIDYLSKKVLEVDPEFFDKIDTSSFGIYYKNYSKYRKTPYKKHISDEDGFVTKKLKNLSNILNRFGHKEAYDIIKISNISRINN